MTTPFDLTAFNELLTTKQFARTLIFEPSVGSTMDLARTAARQSAPEGTLALADEQTAGRGRLGRSWVTPPALNLASTLVLHAPPALARQVAMIAPLAVLGALETQHNIRGDIKWPNDVQVDGRKIAGILIESDFDVQPPAVLVGVGINVNFDPREHEEIRDIATSVAAIVGHAVPREPLLAAYALRFEHLYDRAKAGASVRDAWRARLVTLGQRVTVTHPGGVTEGVAEDVDADGALLVRTADGALVSVEAGDVTLRV